MQNFSFNIPVQSSKSRSRRGILTTPHGVVQTPAFVTVGTKATIKSLTPQDVEKTGTQFMFANTYHLVLSPGTDIVAAHGGIHAMSGINKPMITDSGGFQVFSLAFPDAKSKREGVSLTPGDADDNQPALVTISDDGVEFRAHSDGQKYFFTPEFSIEAQQKIGADFMVAFDECIYNGATKKYTEEATRRTHEWAVRSIKKAEITCADNGPQRLYGVIQGGMFKDLREMSTEYTASLPYFGIALGGVSVGETIEELTDEITWMMDVLHADKRPRHLLGISTFDDVLYGVEQGIDTFDCILPTRDARTGRLYVRTGEKNGIGVYEKINIKNAEYKSRVEAFHSESLGEVSYAYLHHLFKQKELLFYRLATIHNLYMIEQFFAEIRTAIEDGRL